jgi:putative DNA primase/helicase
MVPDAAAMLHELPRVEVPPDISEDTLALAFTARHRDELRYVHEWGRWLRWDGARWAIERTLAVFDMARALTRAIGGPITNERLATKIQSAATVAAIVSLARADRAHARVTEDFDVDLWALNTPVGTVDLRTGEMRPHRREDGITKVTRVAPSTAPAPRWQACLATWADGDDALIAFLQRLCGYWLTGSVKEEKLTIIHGPGGNGKTKFIETVRGCLGHDYATGVAMETLIVTAGEQHPTDLADLRGKRLAIATETDEGRRLAEAKVKALTGGDRIRARHMRRDFFEFEPTHKLVIVGNHRPVLRNVDEAMRRRLLLLPFTAVIAPEDRDVDLAEKLLAERPAILRWMIDGCLAWQEEGLDPPARVLAATEDYLETADAFGRWLDECCVIAPNATMTKAAAFAAKPGPRPQASSSGPSDG